MFGFLFKRTKLDSENVELILTFGLF